MVAGINKRPCILVADEYELNREAVSIWLMRMLPDATVFGMSSCCVGGGDPAPDLLSLILFALRQPFHHSLVALQDFRKRFPYIPMVLMSDVVDDRVMAVARAHGVSGLFQASESAEDFLEVIRFALNGKLYSLPEKRKKSRVNYCFSPRQMEVLGLLCEGKSNKEIAAVLKMSDNTVRTHVSAIFNKLGVRNRTEAVISGRHLI